MTHYPAIELRDGDMRVWHTPGSTDAGFQQYYAESGWTNISSEGMTAAEWKARALVLAKNRLHCYYDGPPADVAVK